MIAQAGTGWARRSRDTRHIGDISRRKNRDSYPKSLARLLRDLQAGGSAPDP